MAIGIIMDYLPKLEKVVDDRWPQADDDERQLLIEIMKVVPDPKWSKYVFAAEKEQILSSDLLLMNREEIMNSSDEGIASADVNVERGDDYCQRQIGALVSYVAFVVSHRQ